MSSKKKSPYRITVLLAVLLLVTVSCNFPVKFGAEVDNNLVQEIPEENMEVESPTSAPEVTPTEIDYPDDLENVEETTVEPLKLESGSPIPLLSTMISSQGGNIKVPDSGSPLDGFSVLVPPGVYEENVSFDISYSSISAHNLSSDLTPVTPLIQVDNGGVTASDYLEVTVPIQLQDDQFAMLFTINEETGLLEALPLLELDNTHLTAMTTHFSPLLGVAIDKEELDYLKVKTGFKQGVNNWQFANYGSYIAPGGHCAGQSLMAMDFFLRNKGEELFGKYDGYNNEYIKTPNIQDDDRLGYRLCSVAQKRMDWSGKANAYWLKTQRSQDQSITFYSMALALKASGEPQLIAIYTSAGEGHAIIVYGKYRDRFYVSDPNFPNAGAKRYLAFNRSTNKFRTYKSGATAADSKYSFTKFYYINKYHLLNDLTTGDMWAQLEAGTIGDDWFPNYTLKVLLDSSFINLKKYNVFTEGPDIDIQIDSSIPVLISAYDKNNRLVSEDADFNMITVPITEKTGTPYLITIYGDQSGDWSWIDGRWFNFIKSLAGTYRGGRCPEEESQPYRWEVNLHQTPEGKVSGDVYFHACPGGGAVFYSLSGQQVPGESTVELTGSKTGGRGGLGGSPNQVTFTFGYNGRITPNYSP
jgi:hypothetical protein